MTPGSPWYVVFPACSVDEHTGPPSSQSSPLISTPTPHHYRPSCEKEVAADDTNPISKNDKLDVASVHHKDADRPANLVTPPILQEDLDDEQNNGNNDNRKCREEDDDNQPDDMAGTLHPVVGWCVPECALGAFRDLFLNTVRNSTDREAPAFF